MAMLGIMLAATLATQSPATASETTSILVVLRLAEKPHTTEIALPETGMRYRITVEPLGPKRPPLPPGSERTLKLLARNYERVADAIAAAMSGNPDFEEFRDIEHIEAAIRSMNRQALALTRQERDDWLPFFEELGRQYLKPSDPSEAIRQFRQIASELAR